MKNIFSMEDQKLFYFANRMIFGRHTFIGYLSVIHYSLKKISGGGKQIPDKAGFPKDQVGIK